MMTTNASQLMNYINGDWQLSGSEDNLSVINPATAEVIAQVPLSASSKIDEATDHAVKAFEDWRRTPAGERVQYLFKLKNLLEDNLEEMARILTNECGKTYQEALGELRRGIENVEVACGIPSLIQGSNNEDIAQGIDEYMIRQPLGVVAAITPFNFPGMIPLWFLPYAIACGNCFILKPSEKVPMTSAKLFELVEKTGLPKGVAQLVHGDKESVDALLDHPDIKAISFVGSTPIAQYVYARATANGKRAQCQGGAKNVVIIMPDADLEETTRIVTESAFGCAGQRCLAASLAIAVGEVGKSFTESITESASNLRVGYGLDEGIDMGPVITSESKGRIESLVDAGCREGAKLRLDGRGQVVTGQQDGYFVFPSILEDVDVGSEIARTEIFGPVLSILRAESIDDAISVINQNNYGNMACLFTSSGGAARQFRYEAAAGNIGINIGVAAPMAFFPFSGWKDSFFGDLHAQGPHGVEFYTQIKVVVERWPQISD
jgi:malonate-semialdehyde dehydrogenase (acetylating)/methylmalonate-semialdehyde dehydrogenase